MAINAEDVLKADATLSNPLTRALQSSYKEQENHKSLISTSIVLELGQLRLQLQ